MFKRIRDRIAGAGYGWKVGKYHLQHCALTGVFLRQWFELNRTHVLNNLRRQDDPVCLFKGDIDNFKLINDTFGHGGGDLLLSITGQVMSRRLRRPADVLVRYGGDEFFAIVPGGSSNFGQIIENDLREALTQPAVIENFQKLGNMTSQQAAVILSYTGISTAIMKFDARSDDFSIIYQELDDQMYEVKKSKKASRKLKRAVNA